MQLDEEDLEALGYGNPYSQVADLLFERMGYRARAVFESYERFKVSTLITARQAVPFKAYSFAERQRCPRVRARGYLDLR